MDEQLRARPGVEGRLFLYLSRGSEVYVVGPAGPRLLERRTTTPLEEEHLAAAAEALRERLTAAGLDARLVPGHLNRRSGRPRPGLDRAARRGGRRAPAARGGASARRRLRRSAWRARAGARARPGGRTLAPGDHQRRAAHRHRSHRQGRRHARGDARAGARARQASRGTCSCSATPLAPSPTARHRLRHAHPGAASRRVRQRRAGACRRAAAGAARRRRPVAFLDILHDQLAMREIVAKQSFPEPIADPAWRFEVKGFDPFREREAETWLRWPTARTGTRGALEEGSAISTPATFVAGVFGDGPGDTAVPPAGSGAGLDRPAAHGRRKRAHARERRDPGPRAGARPAPRRRLPQLAPASAQRADGARADRALRLAGRSPARWRRAPRRCPRTSRVRWSGRAPIGVTHAGGPTKETELEILEDPPG